MATITASSELPGLRDLYIDDVSPLLVGVMQVMKPYVSWFANININGQRVKVKVDWSTLYQYSLAEYSIPWKSYSEGTIHHHGVAKLQCTAVSPKGRLLCGRHQSTSYSQSSSIDRPESHAEGAQVTYCLSRL